MPKKVIVSIERKSEGRVKVKVLLDESGVDFTVPPEGPAGPLSKEDQIRALERSLLVAETCAQVLRDEINAHRT